MSRINTMNGFASWLGDEKLQFIELQKQISPTALFHSSRRKHFVEFCCPHDLTTTRLPPGSFPSNFIQLLSHLILEFDVAICGKVHVSSIPQKWQSILPSTNSKLRSFRNNEMVAIIFHLCFILREKIKCFIFCILYMINENILMGMSEMKDLLFFYVFNLGNLISF